MDRHTTERERSALLVGNFFGAASGGAQVSEQLCHELKQSGWSVLTTSSRRQRLLRLLDMVGKCCSWRRRYGVAHVDVFSGDAFLWAQAVCWALRRTAKPYVLTLRGGNLPEFARRRTRRVERLLRSAAAVTTPSRYLFEAMRPYRNDLELIPNPIYLRTYTYRVRRHVRPRLVWLRAFHDIYNPTLAPQMLAQLAAELPEIELTMVGPDKGDGSRQRTEEEAKQLGVADRIRFQGPVPKVDVPLYLDQADVFINTTNIDNTPVSVLEAMASGLCVVSTNVGGIPYLLDAEQDALLVPPDDAEAMAGAVRRVLTEPELAERLSTNGRGKACEADWSAVLPRWQQLLASFL
jgi:glycosyltransferase involved in cell wall biosynthesis